MFGHGATAGDRFLMPADASGAQSLRGLFMTVHLVLLAQQADAALPGNLSERAWRVLVHAACTACVGKCA